MSFEKTKVVIVGSGIFGMSTALWMLTEGREKYEVTILEKCGIIPAPDAASTDLNKIIRAADYADPHLAGLALDAVEHWRKPEWEGTYHESGVLVLSGGIGHEDAGAEFVESAYKNCLDLGIEAKLLPDSEAVKAVWGSTVPTGSFGGRNGYSNPIGGWAEAGRAVEVGLKRVRLLGGTVRGGAEVVGLVKEGKKVQGVKLKDGEEVTADLVVVAAGAWTPQLFASPGVSARLPPIVATGQSVAVIQLTPEEVETYAKIPVVFNLDDGWYNFPPNPSGLMKMAIHAAGYTNPTTEAGVSVPRTKLTPGAEDGMIPLVMLRRLRQGLSEVYPELANKDFVSTRLCWYCDTVTGDWLIDYHPDFDNLFIATGGSGHAFKFATVIGREILKTIERNPSPQYVERWAFKASLSKEEIAEKSDVTTEAPEVADAGADVRVGTRKPIRIEDLATADDLKCSVAVAA